MQSIRTGTRSSGILIFIVDPNLLPVEVFRLLKIEFDLPPDSEVLPSGTSALDRRTDGRFGVDPSVVLRPVGTKKRFSFCLIINNITIWER